jgi:hypothetical protein
LRTVARARSVEADVYLSGSVTATAVPAGDKRTVR